MGIARSKVICLCFFVCLCVCLGWPFCGGSRGNHEPDFDTRLCIACLCGMRLARSRLALARRRRKPRRRRAAVLRCNWIFKKVYRLRVLSFASKGVVSHRGSRFEDVVRSRNVQRRGIPMASHFRAEAKSRSTLEPQRRTRRVELDFASQGRRCARISRWRRTS